MKGPAMSHHPSYVLDDQLKSTRKFHNLLQDFNDLHKETEEKKKTMQRAKRRRNVLLAEVRFLRQRYEELMEYQRREQNLARTQLQQTRTPPVETIRRDREAVPSHPTPVLDLNQIANDEEEETEVNHAVESMKEPMKTEKIPMKFSVNRGGKPPLPPRQKDLKLSVCRDIQKGSNRAGKRKISIQDPLALRV